MGAAESRNERFYHFCGLGKAHLVEKMLESDKLNHTININWVSFETKSTPLLAASANGHEMVVELLLRNNANPNLSDAYEYTALHHAAQRGYAEIIKKLINAGCSVDAFDQQLWTPLMKSCYWCQPDAVFVLIESGANVHLKNSSHRTALHELCRSQAPNKDDSLLAEITLALVEAGANINERSSENLTPLMYAAYHNHPGIALVLIESNCQIDAIDHQGWTALHWACDRDNPEIVQLLLDKGCDQTIRGIRSGTARMRAKSDRVRAMFADDINEEPSDDTSYDE